MVSSSLLMKLLYYLSLAGAFVAAVPFPQIGVTSTTEPEPFISFANAPGTPIDQMYLQAQAGSIFLGGQPSAYLCPPPPSSCPEMPVNPTNVSTAFLANLNGTAEMATMDPSLTQTLYVGPTGALTYTTYEPYPAYGGPPPPPGNSTFSGFKQYTIPPRGTQATTNSTLRFTGGGASSFIACIGPLYKRYQIFANVGGFDQTLYNLTGGCVQFVAVAVSGWPGIKAWAYQ